MLCRCRARDGFSMLFHRIKDNQSRPRPTPLACVKRIRPNQRTPTVPPPDQCGRSTCERRSKQPSKATGVGEHSSTATDTYDGDKMRSNTPRYAFVGRCGGVVWRGRILRSSKSQRAGTKRCKDTHALSHLGRYGTIRRLSPPGGVAGPI